MIGRYSEKKKSNDNTEKSEIKIDGMLPLEERPSKYLRKNRKEFYLKNNKGAL